MSDTEWRLSGDYFETCNCDFLCPCPTSNLTAQPTKGGCDAALVFQVNQGSYGEVTLDGVTFVAIVRTPGPMADGDWTVGLIVDDGASAEQRDAVAAICSGEVGGPMARTAPLVSNFAGVESAAIRIEGSGLSRSIKVGELLDQAVEGVAGAMRPDEPIYLDNVGHPANTRLGLAKATRSHVHAFGIDWDDTSGTNNAHLAPFDWQGP
jgi:hypothetical protein